MRDTSDHDRLKTLFVQLVEATPPERATLLAVFAEREPELYDELQQLMSADERSESPLDKWPVELLKRAAEPRLPQRIGRYDIVSFLGAGGMGHVYLAKDTTLDRVVALKFLPAECAENMDRIARFRTEAKAAAALNHAGVATVFDIGEAHGRTYIVMEYIQGKTLAEEIATRLRIIPDEIVTIGKQVSDVLAAAHDKGIIHRDIKPANIMICPDGRIKVLDFGVAKIRPVLPTVNAPYGASSIVGTAEYMSPEQALGQPVDHRTDLFSLGVVLYELATGVSPFAGLTMAEALERVVHTNPEPISTINPDVSVECESVIMRCLQKEHEKRYGSARELWNALDASHLEAQGNAPTTGVVDVLEKEHSREARPDDGRTASGLNVSHAHVFNDDLLIDTKDYQYARSQFPATIHVLNHPRLKETFARYDTDAIAARDRVRKCLLFTVCLGVIGVLVIASKPIWPDVAGFRVLAAFTAAVGLLGMVVGNAVLRRGTWKRRWLQSRLMTELLRQWHFQFIVRCGQQIEKSCQGPARISVFTRARDLQFDDFLKRHEGNLDAKLEALLRDDDSPMWLHDRETPFSGKGPIFAEITRAYERLRLDHQYAYTLWKLSKETDKPVRHFFSWPVVSQRSSLSAIATSCMTVAIVCFTILCLGLIFNMGGFPELYLRTTAIASTLCGAALRRLENGLIAETEIKSYEHYRSTTSDLRERFKSTADPAELVQIMKEMECAAFGEMKEFLRANADTRLLFI